MPSEEKVVREYVKLKVERDKILNSMRAIHDYSKSLSKETAHRFKFRYEIIALLESSFEKIQSEIIQFNSRQNLPKLN